MYTGFRIKSITEYTFIRVTREHHLTKLLIFPLRIYSGKHTIKKKKNLQCIFVLYSLQYSLNKEMNSNQRKHEG